MNIKAAIITGNLINDVIFNSRLTIGAPLDTFDGGAQSTRTTITVTYHFSFHLFPNISYSRPRPSLMHTYVGPRKARCDFKQWKGHGSYILASRNSLYEWPRLDGNECTREPWISLVHLLAGRLAGWSKEDTHQWLVDRKTRQVRARKLIKSTGQFHYCFRKQTEKPKTGNAITHPPKHNRCVVEMQQYNV